MGYSATTKIQQTQLQVRPVQQLANKEIVVKPLLAASKLPAET